MRQYYAHSAPENGQKHLLKQHLLAVAETAAAHAAKFDAATLGHAAGLYHDLGKYRRAFQEYLDDPKARRGPGHKAVGAAHAASRLCTYVGWAILGHHGGLPALADVRNAADSLPPDLSELLVTARADQNDTSIARSGDCELPPPPWLDSAHGVEFFTRMLFSALADADGLDTEAHFHPERAALRGQGVGLGELWRRLERAQEQLSGLKTDRVNRARDEVYRACLRAAGEAPGFFRLTVPTGGGKTRSGLAFALCHAQNHGLDRVIVAAPYTAIIEQTADNLRAILGDDAVLEHHSAVDADERDEDRPGWATLAAQNWDTPVIVTTAVQLLESLFHNRPGRCRKLHNIARSVVILDEVQTLPPELLTPIMDVLNELVRHYRVSVVLCTATQPAWDALAALPGLAQVGRATEIAPDPARLFRELERVTYRIEDQPLDWPAAAGLLRAEEQALAVVNTRAHALALLDALDDPDALHLSTLLCGAHRRDVLARTKDRLSHGEPCRLISTQTIEAGVDIDFPFVMRAVGPLDRMVQAAGRCNREGLLDRGTCVIFTPAAEGMPRGSYRAAADVAVNLIAAGAFDPNDPRTFDRYFTRWLAHVETDALHIQALRRAFDYPEVAARFHIIRDEQGVPAVVRYRGPSGQTRADELISRLRAGSGPPSVLFRKLQPFIVSVPRYRVDEYQRRGLLVSLVPGLWEWTGEYDDRRGIGTAAADPANYVF